MSQTHLCRWWHFRFPLPIISDCIQCLGILPQNQMGYQTNREVEEQSVDSVGIAQYYRQLLVQHKCKQVIGWLYYKCAFTAFSTQGNSYFKWSCVLCDEYSECLNGSLQCEMSASFPSAETFHSSVHEMETQSCDIMTIQLIKVYNDLTNY